MALSDKNILITPNVGQSADPKIEFKGADASTGAQTITLQVYPTDGGTISFEGSAGQLFSITNSLTGTIYSVNDVSGIPSIEVLDTGLVKLAEYGGNVLIGTGTDSGEKLQVAGGIKTPTMWVNYSTSNYNGYNENIRLYPADNGAAVIAFGAATGSTTGSPWNSVLGYSDRLEIRRADQWQLRSYANYVEAYGYFKAPYFQSTVASGTAPLTVASTTVVTNLNADLLDGNHASAFAATNQTFYLGTTQVAINRASGVQDLTGITSISSIDQVGLSSPGNVTIKAGLGIDADVGPGGYSGGAVTISGGTGEGSGALGGVVTITGGEVTGSIFNTVLGGNVLIRGGRINSTESLTKITGSVYIDGGGSGANGTITYGSVYIGNNANSTTTGTTSVIIGRSGNTVKLPGVGTSGFVKLGAGGQLSADTNTYALSSHTHNYGTVTSVGGTGTVSGLTLSGTVTTSGNLTLGGTLSASIDNLTDEHRIFNNMGDNHGTRTSFDASAPSYNFGWRFVQGSTNGPGVNSATQYYSLYVGLGNDYAATGAGSYGMQLAVPRNVTTPYLTVRYNENNSLGSWQKINAGYADTSGNASTATTLQTARALTIGNTGKSFDGSQNVSWTLGEMGAAATDQTFYLGTTPIAINRSSGSLSISNVNVYGNLYGLGQSGSTPPSSVTVRAGIGVNAALGPPSNGYGGASTTVAGGLGQGQGATGGTLILQGGEATGVTSSGYGGNVYITGGKVTSSASIVKVGGSVVIDGGGSGANGTITYGTVYIGYQVNGTEYGTKEVIIGKSGTPVKLPGVGTSGFVTLGAGGQLSADTNTYALSSHNHTYNVNDAWLRDNGDDAHVKLYGNSRQMVFRTDGTTEYASGVGGYAFAWMYGGDAAANRVMLIDTSGDLWTSTNGWLSTALAGKQPAGSYLTAESDTLASVTARGFTTRASSGAFATNTQGTPGLEIYGGGGTEPAYMTFHRPGQYAIRLGLDGSDLKVGGWSLGSVGYKIWHEGNDGSGSGLDADLVDGLQVHTARNNEADKVVRTDANGYIQAGYINSSSGNEGNNSSPARVWGTNGSDDYLRTYLTSALSVAYAATAGSAPANGGTSSAVTINYNNDSNSTYQMLWGSGNSVYGTAGIYCNPFSDKLYATSFALGPDDNNRFQQGGLILRSASPTIYFRDTDGNSAMLHNNSNLFYILRGANDSETWTQVGSYWPVYWDLTNNNATFGGSIWAASNITAYSDVKLKENIVTVDNALEKTLKLRGVYYTRKDDPKSERRVGVVAQEIKEILPEVVKLHKDEEDPEGTYAVDYGNITALLIEAIKEQQAQIDHLKKLLESRL